VSVPGTVERHTGRVGVAPNLGWRSVPFRDLVDTRIASRVAVGNDADLAVLAEHRRGSARGCDDVAYLIGRVGVGAGIIVNGVPLRGAAGHAGEIGHNVMDLAGPECHCGNRGCVETFVGDIALLGLAGRVGPPTEEQVRSVFEDARSGKKTELQAVRTVAGALGRTIAEVVNTVDPKRVICGGSLSEILDIAGDEVRRSFERFVFTGGADVELVQPAFAADGAMLGAAEIAFEALLADPLSAAG
jgi:predicted NBD/HSP70 family sugar kinase